MPRATMTELVNRIRSVCAAGETDEFQGQTFWDDDQLEAELDREKTDLFDQRLTPAPRRINGTITNKTQRFTFGTYWLEPIFVVHDSEGTEIPEADYTVTVSDQAGQVVFTNEPTGRMYIDLIVFDWHGAASSIWKQKAAHRADFVKVKAGDHTIDFEAEYKHCLQMSEAHDQGRIKTYQHRQGRFVVDSANRWTV